MNIAKMKSCFLILLLAVAASAAPRKADWQALTSEEILSIDQKEDVVEDAITVSERDVTFHFYTPEKPKGTAVKRGQLHDIVKLTHFNVNRETLIVVHGWLNNNASAVNDYIKTAAQESGRNINIIVADWSRISRKNYITAQASVLKVGNYIGDFLLELKKNLKKSLDQVTIVGHSLGAHVAGNTGARCGGQLNTIVGLDPAGPLFSKRRTDNRLDPTDAKFVQVMHTNDIMLGFGIVMGHVDIYPNGGNTQPGCAWDPTGTCSHLKAYKFYAESLLNNNFLAWKCDSTRKFKKGKCSNNRTTKMGGFPVDKKASGEFWLFTNRKSPYGQGGTPHDETDDGPDPAQN